MSPIAMRAAAHPAAPAEAHTLERFADAGPDEPLREVEDLERHRDVLEGAPRSDELEVLKDDPEVPPQKGDRVVAQTCHVAAQKENAAVVDRIGAIEQAQERRLSGAARSACGRGDR